MFMLREPSDADVARFIASQRDLPFTYAEVGATNATPPAGYNVDHNRIQLGTGEATYRSAVDALKKWRHFELGWVAIVPAGGGGDGGGGRGGKGGALGPAGVVVEVGATVAVKARAFGTWSLNASRVVYVIDESRRFGFAYGTLPDHVERGEERFLIERLPDNTVWYDILAFSRPHHPLVKLSSPLARRLQRRFARDSLSRMVAVLHG